jgi:3-oxoadipate enol-lactonase
MPIAAVGADELHYLERGEGEPLLLIMGMSGSHLHWGEPFLAELDPHFHSISYDHRGVGDSTPLSGPITIVEMADDAAGLLDALELDSAHVVGISMGGMIAQELALRHPDRVRTLTLGCTYAGGEGGALAGPEVVELLTTSLASGDRELAIRAGWQVNVSAGWAADPDHFASFHELAQRMPVPVPVIMAQMKAVAGHDTSTRLDQIGAPTLVIHGTEDRMLPIANATAIANRIPGARLEIFDAVGHLFFWERPAESARLVRELAAAHSAAAPDAAPAQ